MSRLKTIFKNRLKDVKKIAIVGVGSELRGDDAAGILVAGQLKRYGRNHKKKKLKVFLGHTAPENITGEIKQFEPEHIIIIDSAEMGKKAGAVALITMDEVGGYSFCTHSLPLKVMIDYLMEFINCGITIIGIQPKRIAFGLGVSKEIRVSVKKIALTIVGSINDI